MREINEIERKGNETRRAIRPAVLNIQTSSVGITKRYPAYAGSSCNATEHSPERRRTIRLPLSGTALLQKRNEPRPCGSPVYPTAALWSRARTDSCLLPVCCALGGSAASLRAKRASHTPHGFRARSAHTARLRSLPHTPSIRMQSWAFKLRLVKLI